MRKPAGMPAFLRYASFDFSRAYDIALLFELYTDFPNYIFRQLKLSENIGRFLDPQHLFTSNVYKRLGEEQNEFKRALDSIIETDQYNEEARHIHEAVLKHCPAKAISLIVGCCTPSLRDDLEFKSIPDGKVLIRPGARKREKRLYGNRIMAKIETGENLFWQELHLWLALNHWESLGRCKFCGKFIVSTTKRKKEYCSGTCRVANFRRSDENKEKLYHHRKLREVHGREWKQKTGSAIKKK